MLITLVSLSSSAVVGQSSDMDLLPRGLDLDAQIPAPEKILQQDIASWHLRHDQLLLYVKTLASASDRVVFQSYARSWENRELGVLIITHPDNHARLAEIRAARQTLRTGDADLDAQPLVLYMGYSVHGNEASGSNAAPMVAYYLAAARGQKMETFLRNTVILLDASFNPDGMGRFATWVNMHKSASMNGDSQHREHQEMWPSGRTNHYWFDLNRDWLPVQHPESRGRVALFQQWLPNILTDHHEMGSNSTFFFQPGVPTRKNPLIPDKNVELTNQIAGFHRTALDSIGSLYYSLETFDDFYFGKGSTYPDAQGAIGILFEQASARGHLQDTNHGKLSFPFAVRNQVRVSLSTLAAAGAMRKPLLSYMHDVYNEYRETAQKSKLRAYVVGDGGDPARLAAYQEILQRHSIKTYALSKRHQANGQLFSPGASLFVPLQQPQYGLITALFEKRTSFTDSIFYDVSAWTLPLAFNLPYAEIRDKGAARSLQGAPLQERGTPPVQHQVTETDYAVLIPWQPYAAPAVLYSALATGLRVKAATRAFPAITQSGEQTFPAGTLLVPAGIQAQPIAKWLPKLKDAASKAQVPLTGMRVGSVPAGDAAGSPQFRSLKLPKIAFMVGRSVSSYEVGEAWHLLDQRYRIPVSLLENQNLARYNLRKYTTLVMVSGSYSTLDSSDIKKIREWVAEGGTLITQGSGASWAIKHKIGSGTLVKSDDKKTDKSRRPFAARSRDRGAQQIGGAIFAAELDLTHPLCFGYQAPQVSVFRRGQTFLAPAKDRYQTPVLHGAAPLQAGYISDANLKKIAGSAVITTSRHGRGRVVYFANNSNFRAFWYGTNKFFANALFFSSLF